MFRVLFVVAALVAFATPIAAAVVYVAVTEDPVRVDRPQSVAGAVPKPTAPAVGFQGLTSQKLGISFDLASDGRTIEDLHVAYKADCGETLAFELADRFYTPVAVDPEGSFYVEGVGKRLTFSGRVANGQASGRVRVNYDYGGFLQCTTPILRWSAATA